MIVSGGMCSPHIVHESLVRSELSTTTVILVLRTYALYRRNNKILALMLSVAVVLIGISGVCRTFRLLEPSTSNNVSQWSITGQQSNINIVDGCHWGLLQDTFVFIVPIVVATPSKTDIPFESRGVRMFGSIEKCFGFVHSGSDQVPRLHGRRY